MPAACQARLFSHDWVISYGHGKVVDSNDFCLLVESTMNCWILSGAPKLPQLTDSFVFQWSPVNPEGKKQYERDFLLQLQKNPLSLQKPVR